MKIFKELGRFRHLILAFLGLFLVFGLQIIPAVSQDTGKPFVVATEPTFPPFEMTDEATGTLTGFDIDLIKAIGQEAGINIQIESLPFDGIIPALQARTVEAAISGMTITAERAQAISFSRPYFRAGLAIAVREDNRTIKNFEDLKGKRIAVQIGTTGALEATKIPGATVSQFDSAALALQELINGSKPFRGGRNCLGRWYGKPIAASPKSARRASPKPGLDYRFLQVLPSPNSHRARFVAWQKPP
jgi:arginine/lysine/histidine/glutamine transport system substrate-binding/permease protein